jgi:hypothetical protein
LPHVDSATFRGIVTAVQVGGAAAIVFLTDPQLINFLNLYVPGLIPYLAVSSGAIAMIIGVLRRDVPNY